MIVEGLDEEERRARIDELASFHDAVLASVTDGVISVRRPRAIEG
jgi:hypothetical protein